MGPELSRAPISLGPLNFFFFLLVDFFPQGRDLPNGGGGRRSKHWPRALETLATPLPHICDVGIEGQGGHAPRLRNWGWVE